MITRRCLELPQSRLGRIQLLGDLILLGAVLDEELVELSCNKQVDAKFSSREASATLRVMEALGRDDEQPASYECQEALVGAISALTTPQGEFMLGVWTFRGIYLLAPLDSLPEEC